MLFSPTRPRSICAASGSLPTHVVGFLLHSIILYVQGTDAISRRQAGGQGPNPPVCIVVPFSGPWTTDDCFANSRWRGAQPGTRGRHTRRAGMCVFFHLFTPNTPSSDSRPTQLLLLPDKFSANQHVSEGHAAASWCDLVEPQDGHRVEGPTLRCRNAIARLRENT